MKNGNKAFSVAKVPSWDAYPKDITAISPSHFRETPQHCPFQEENFSPYRTDTTLTPPFSRNIPPPFNPQTNRPKRLRQTKRFCRSWRNERFGGLSCPGRVSPLLSVSCESPADTTADGRQREALERSYSSCLMGDKGPSPRAGKHSDQSCAPGDPYRSASGLCG